GARPASDPDPLDRAASRAVRRRGWPTVIARIWINARMQFDELAHIPAFTVPSMGLPLVAYVTFGLPTIHGDARLAAGVFAGFAAFAFLGIVMFQFGVGIAA